MTELILSLSLNFNFIFHSKLKKLRNKNTKSGNIRNNDFWLFFILNIFKQKYIDTKKQLKNKNIKNIYLSELDEIKLIRYLYRSIFIKFYDLFIFGFFILKTHKTALFFDTKNNCKIQIVNRTILIVFSSKCR